MENQENKQIAFQEVSVTYTVEEAIEFARVFDNMLDVVASNVFDEGTDKKLLEDALLANLFVKRLREKVYNAVLEQ